MRNLTVEGIQKCQARIEIAVLMIELFAVDRERMMREYFDRRFAEIIDRNVYAIGYIQELLDGVEPSADRVWARFNPDRLADLGVDPIEFVYIIPLWLDRDQVAVGTVGTAPNPYKPQPGDHPNEMFIAPFDLKSVINEFFKQAIGASPELEYHMYNELVYLSRVMLNLSRAFK